MKPLVEQLRDAQQAGVEIIEPWDHNPYLFGEAADRIEQLEAGLELIAGSSSDKLQVMQARSALDNIGANVDQQGTQTGEVK